MSHKLGFFDVTRGLMAPIFGEILMQVKIPPRVPKYISDTFFCVQRSSEEAIPYNELKDELVSA